MKTNKFKNIAAALILILAITGLFSSCEEYGGIDSQVVGAPALTSDALAQYDAQTLSPENIVFSVSANTPWQISVATDAEEQSWCVVTPGNSAASALVAEVTVKMTTNTTTSPRVATLTITAENVNEPVVVKVVQAPRGNLHVEGPALYEEFATDPAETKTMTILSNKAWEIVCDQPWVTFSAISGTASDEPVTIDVTAQANSGLKREASFTLKTTMDEVVRTIVQKGISLEVLAEDAEVLSAVPAQPEATVTVGIDASVDWTAETEATWITSLTRNGDALEFTFDNNSNFAPREAIVTLAGGGLTTEVVVKQEGAAFIVWDRVNGVEVELPEGMLTEEGILLKRADGYEIRFPNHYKRGEFVWEFSEISTTMPLAIQGAVDYNAGVVPNTHIVMSNISGSVAGPNDWRVNNGGGNGWWLTWQNVTVLKYQCNDIRTIRSEYSANNGITLDVFNAAGELMTNKTHAVATDDAKWVGTPGFAYCLYFPNQAADATDYCVLKSFKAVAYE
ncbi:BACON domain-containing carbohydrate-binding protein [Maribellus sp. YY47]|uniref:BACON domain-containing protein n=1 Tax=Maribellus sp. YY47 TaxID=2929486 RepID=UPI002001CB60|nr:BACON domain-containing carbohydrate-binding protein [Maribellus sp. YY47]MCK3683222.1 hypothetical protein [Maribellus sp. YY47]